MTQESTARAVQLMGLDPQPKTGPSAFGTNMALIQGVKVRVSVSVGQREMSVKELFALKAGEVVELDRASNDPVDLFLDSKLIGRGELVVVGENFGIRILELGDA